MLAKNNTKIEIFSFNENARFAESKGVFSGGFFAILSKFVNTWNILSVLLEICLKFKTKPRKIKGLSTFQPSYQHFKLRNGCSFNSFNRVFNILVDFCTLQTV